MSTDGPSPHPSSCPVCSSRLEEDGVCLACALTAALTAADEETGESAHEERAFASLGRRVLPCSLAGYHLLREIASGGMGIVYEAEDPRLKRRVALKMLRSAAFARPEELARFRVEAELAAQLEHPHIVPIYEVGDVDGMPFFTMRLIEGSSLGAKLAEKGCAMSSRDAAALMVKVARAVQHAHERGVLHRDLKPANILLDEHGEPHLTDFGLAKLLDDDSSLTRSTAHLGTPHYMSPEQAAGRTREITTASDVWALGVLLYQLLTRHLPFTGDSSMAIMQQIATQEPRSLSDQKIDADLATIIVRCLEKEPAKRLASASFFADELERWLRGEPVLSRRINAWERSMKWVRAHRGATAAMTITSLAIFVGSGVALWQWRQAVTARDQAQHELKDATDVTDLLVKMLTVFDEKQGGPVTTKTEIIAEFLKRVEAFEGDPQRQIALITQTGTLLEQDENSRCYRKAAEIAQRTLPPDDPQIWYLRWRAASTSPGGAGESEHVLPELRVVYEWHRDHLGPDHPDTLRVMHSLAKRIIERGGQVEALQMLEKVRTYIEQHPDQPPPVSPALLHSDLMRALFFNDRVDEALAVGRESCRRAVASVIPATSHQTGRACHMLAKFCRAAGLKEEAIEHAREALDIYWRFEGPASKDALEVLDLLLAWQRLQGDGEAVLATQRDALRAFDMTLGPSRVETQRQVAAYAQTLVELGRTAEADALYQQWLDRLRGSDGRLAPEAAELEQLWRKFEKQTKQ